MIQDPENYFRASLAGGGATAVFAAILWPIVVRLIEQPGITPNMDSSLATLLTVFFMAFIGGLFGAIVFGMPLFLALKSFTRHSTLLGMILGGGLGLTCYLLGGPSFERAPASASWPLLVYFSVLGAVCGLSATWFLSYATSRRS